MKLALLLTRRTDVPRTGQEQAGQETWTGELFRDRWGVRAGGTGHAAKHLEAGGQGGDCRAAG